MHYHVSGFITTDPLYNPVLCYAKHCKLFSSAHLSLDTITPFSHKETDSETFHNLHFQGDRPGVDSIRPALAFHRTHYCPPEHLVVSHLNYC